MEQQSRGDVAVGSRRLFLSAVALVAAAPVLHRLPTPPPARLPAPAPTPTPTATPAGLVDQDTAQGITVRAGQTYVVQQTTRVHEVSIAPGGTLAAPAGYSLTMTVNGVTTGCVLTQTGGTDTAIAPGTYRGDVVLTVAVATPVPWQAPPVRSGCRGGG